MCIGLSCDAHVTKSVFLDLFVSNSFSIGCILENCIVVREFLRKNSKLSNVRMSCFKLVYNRISVC